MRMYVLRYLRIFSLITLFLPSVFVKKLIVRRSQYILYDGRITMCTATVIRVFDGRQTTTLWLKSLQQKFVKCTGQNSNQSAIKVCR